MIKLKPLIIASLLYNIGMHNRRLTATIPPEKDGFRLDQVLAYLFPEYSRTYLQRQIQNYCVEINGESVNKRSLHVFSGQSIQMMPFTDLTETPWEGSDSIPLNIIYEDEALIVINKPPGVVTHPAPGHLSHTLVNALLYHAPQLSQLPRSGIIHRLDKDTSGLLVIPKILTAHTYLVRELLKRQIVRIYQAVVKGHFIASGTVSLPIGRHPKHRQKQAVIPQGKPAITHYRILERFAQHTLLEIKLETGRTHQIRVHMAHLNHPLIGDPVYGSRNQSPISSFKRQALHAHTLGLRHPLTHQFYYWHAPIPEDMQQLLTQLQEDSP